MIIYLVQSMATFSSLLVISLLIVCVFSFNHQRLENDHMCSIKGGVLCVKDELIIIQNTAEDIESKSIEIEKHVRINFKRKKFS